MHIRQYEQGKYFYDTLKCIDKNRRVYKRQYEIYTKSNKNFVCKRTKPRTIRRSSGFFGELALIVYIIFYHVYGANNQIT